MNLAEINSSTGPISLLLVTDRLSSTAGFSFSRNQDAGAAALIFSPILSPP